VTTWRKGVLGIVGGLLLGAFGSGLWEEAVKPAGQWASHSILNIVTLGSSAAKDSIYANAAKRYHEAIATELFIFIEMTLTLMAPVTCFIALFLTRRFVTRDFSSAPLSGRKLSPRLVLRLAYGVTLLVVLDSTAFLINQLMILQANNALTFFSQSMAICRPYMDEKQAQMLESRFAAIRTRADYIIVTSELRQLAAANHRTLPNYQPWSTHSTPKPK
jgi:hypothetical protein